jgi:hypothetical protein
MSWLATVFAAAKEAVDHKQLKFAPNSSSIQSNANPTASCERAEIAAGIKAASFAIRQSETRCE